MNIFAQVFTLSSLHRVRFMLGKRFLVPGNFITEKKNTRHKRLSRVIDV